MTPVKSVPVLFFALAATLVAASCRSPGGSTPEERRSSVWVMHDETLAELYAKQPGAQSVVENAPGYAVFSNISTKIFTFGAGNGYGVVVDSGSGRKTYMRMAEGGAGLGLGVQDMRAVFVFSDRETMETFVESGWEFGGDADAAAVTDDTGAEGSVGVSVQGIRIYQFTKHGLAVKAMVSGTKYWKDEDLNR